MRDEHIKTLRRLLRDLFGARYAGVSAARFARAQGYADGFMAALMRTGVLTQGELLAIVAEERAAASGPAVGTLHAAAVAAVAAHVA